MEGGERLHQIIVGDSGFGIRASSAPATCGWRRFLGARKMLRIARRSKTKQRAEKSISNKGNILALVTTPSAAGKGFPVNPC